MAKMNPGFIAEMSLLRERWGGPVLPLKNASYQLGQILPGLFVQRF